MLYSVHHIIDYRSIQYRSFCNLRLAIFLMVSILRTKNNILAIFLLLRNVQRPFNFGSNLFPTAIRLFHPQEL